MVVGDCGGWWLIFRGCGDCGDFLVVDGWVGS